MDDLKAVLSDTTEDWHARMDYMMKLEGIDGTESVRADKQKLLAALLEEQRAQRPLTAQLCAVDAAIAIRAKRSEALGAKVTALEAEPTTQQPSYAIPRICSRKSSTLY